jgi:ribosomal protein S18 acetylase RimI-like enzyme
VSAIAIRAVAPGDAIEIAAVQCASWRTTYAGLVPPEIVAARTEMVPRVELWRMRLADPSCGCVVALLDGVLCAFAAFAPMPERPQGMDPLPGYDAYLEAIYALSAAQRLGIGRALLAAVAVRLRASGYRSLALHVLATNPARGFYERLGARLVREEPALPGETWHGCAYGWPDLAAL